MIENQREVGAMWNNILNKLWFAIYGFPISFGWYILAIKMMFSFSLSRDFFSDGLFFGIIWLVTNGIIWFIELSICTILAALLFGLVWVIERQIVIKVMSPRLRKKLNLENYENIFYKMYRDKKIKN
jgi:hypothetical protein